VFPRGGPPRCPAMGPAGDEGREAVRRLEGLIQEERAEREWQLQQLRSSLASLERRLLAGPAEEPVAGRPAGDDAVEAFGPQTAELALPSVVAKIAPAVPWASGPSSLRSSACGGGGEAKRSVSPAPPAATSLAPPEQSEKRRISTVSILKGAVSAVRAVEATKTDVVVAGILDRGDMHLPEPSVWDATLFIFHPCVGPLVSLVQILMWTLNAFLQLYFCYIVREHMLTPDVSGDVLNGLLRFRLGAGHAVKFADRVARKSLAAQVCGSDIKLHMSGTQLQAATDIGNFLQGGEPLMLLAQFLWLCTVLKELNHTFSFTRALLHLPRGGVTNVVIVDSDGCDDVTNLTTDDARGDALVAISVVTRITTINRLRLWAAVGFIALPRLVIASVLGLVGVLFLGKTSKMEDLLLNAIALAFVYDIDDLLFQVFAPRRLHTLFANLEPLQMASGGRPRLKGAHSIGKALLAGGLLLAVYVSLLEPFFWMLRQAHDVMCTGEQNFVFAVNPASGMMHVAKSSTSVEWTEHERAIIMVARPDIAAKHGWDVDAKLVALSSSDAAAIAVVLPTADSISEAAYGPDYFDTILDMDVWDVEDGAEQLVCKDLGSGQTREATLLHLRALTGNRSLAGCDDVPWQSCAQLDSVQLRATCPMRCNCHKAPTNAPGYSGIFRRPANGCPSQCTSLTASFNEILYMTGSLEEDEGAQHCKDLRAEEFVHAGGCVDTDQFAGSPGPGFNAAGRPCSSYKEFMESDMLDCPADLDDDDFTASQMCCACGGGVVSNRDSVSCLLNLTDDCANMNLRAFWFLLYIKGLFQHLLSNQFFSISVESIVNHVSKIIGEGPSQNSSLVAWVTSGRMAESLLNGKWEFMPDMRHPRDLKGCDFLTSYEFKALLNVDVCSSESYSSLKFLCPVSCGCASSMFENNFSDPPFFEDWGSMPPDRRKVLQFTNDRTNMGECPSECVLPHPLISGDSAWSSFSQRFDDDYFGYYDDS